MYWVYLFFGAAMMLIGGDWLVRGSVGISRRMGLSEFIIAVVIIGIGTSTPELFVSIISGNRDLGTLVLSNNISSNIVDIWGVIGIGAFLSPIFLNGRKHLTDFIFLWVATAILTIMCMFGVITWIHGIVLYGIFAAYLIYAIKAAKQKDAEIVNSPLPWRGVSRRSDLSAEARSAKGEAEAARGRLSLVSDTEPPPPPFGRSPLQRRGQLPDPGTRLLSVQRHYDFLYDNALFRFLLNTSLGLMVLLLLGIGLVYFGSEKFMDALQAVAQVNHLDQTLAGILIVGPGTSMPELIVTIIAAVRRRPQIAIGNIVGSNLMNIALVIPTGAIIMDLPVTRHISHFDVWAMCVALVMLSLNLFVWKKVSRWTAVLYMGLLILYMWTAVMWRG